MLTSLLCGMRGARGVKDEGRHGTWAKDQGDGGSRFFWICVTGGGSVDRRTIDEGAGTWTRGTGGET
jgi:hypothetical protein